MTSDLKLSPLLLLGIGCLLACAPTIPGAVGRSESKVEPAPRARVTCDEQAQQVQRPLTGAARERYIWGCLIEHEFAAYVWERKACESDNECTVVETSCPFGCGAAVASTYAGAVSARHDELLAEFNERADCKYKCNPVVGASCVQRRCQLRHLVEDEVH